MSRRSKNARAFTLIELLVVVAIISLLVSILLPTLSRVREQSRVSVCLSNMRSIGSAAVNYFVDQGDLVFALPKGFVDVESGVHMYGGVRTEFIWGGDVPDAALEDWDPSQGDGPVTYAQLGYKTDILKFTPDRRPLNYYLDPDLSWSDPERFWRGSDQPARTERKSQAPSFFRCPSDKTCAVPSTNIQDPPFDGDTPYTTWKNWGTSYPINWYWGYFYTTAYGLDRNKIINFIGGSAFTGNRGQGRNLLRSKEAYGASEFILFYENQMNFAMENAWVRGPAGEPAVERTRELTGWHRQPDYHTAAYFDGHAEYRKYDTRFVDGPGWTTWPNRDEFDKYDVWKDYANN